MGEIIFQIDAFTDKPFRGNPAAVCILTRHHDDAWMQNVAREMNLSETAFLEEKEMVIIYGGSHRPWRWTSADMPPSPVLMPYGKEGITIPKNRSAFIREADC